MSSARAGLSAALDRRFRLAAHGTSVRREAVAGATTFAAMAYVLAVNPAIMSTTGMDRGDLVSATAIAAIFGSVLMGLSANLPLAVAPAMGSNVVFAYVLVRQMGVPWRAGMGLVARTRMGFLGRRQCRQPHPGAPAGPETLKVGIQAGVGALIVSIGLRSAGFIVANPSTLVAMGSTKSPAVLLTLAGLLATPVLVARRVPGALIASIAGLTLAGLVTPLGPGRMVTRLPAAIVAWPRWPTHTFLAMDPRFLVTHFVLVLPILFYFVCAEFFSTLGTLIGVTGAAGLRRPDGGIPNATAAFATDAVSSIVGPLFGTSVVTAYVESVTGVQAGGRTGLTALTAAVLFAAALFFWPLFTAIPPQATAPALAVVGVLMIQGLARLDLSEFPQAAPAVLVLLTTVLTGNLVDGMALGVFSHIALELALGRGGRIAGVVWGLGAVFAAFLAVSARLG